MKTASRLLRVATVVLGALFAIMLVLPARPDAQSMQRIALTQAPAGHDVAYLSGGCFWSMEAMFRQLRGVDSVIPGFAGGQTANPTYEQVCTETTGHAETIRVVYDPKVLSYRQLLTIFFSAHDPTTLDRQGDDVGASYRSAVWYTNAQQKADAQAAAQDAARAHPGQRIVTEIAPYKAFYAAERYHQNYYNLHPTQPYCAMVVTPKVHKFQAHWQAYLK